MKKLASLAFLFLLGGLAQQSRADYSENFDTASSNPPTDSNFAPQLGWTLSKPKFESSFVVPVTGSGLAVALGGYQSVPAGLDVNMTHALSESLSGHTFSIDFAVAEDSGFPNQDSFNITLTGVGGFVFQLNLVPPATPGDYSREISLSGLGPTGQSIVTTDYNSEEAHFYNLSVDFMSFGSSMLYSATVSGSTTAIFNGSLPDQAGASANRIAIGYSVSGGTVNDAGGNIILVDNISFATTVPEAGASMLGLLAVGMLTLRRRR